MLAPSGALVKRSVDLATNNRGVRWLFVRLRPRYEALPPSTKEAWRRFKMRAGIRVAAIEAEDDDNHPERLEVLGALGPGRVLEVGCGHRKTAPTFVGVDLVPGGGRGGAGQEAWSGHYSQADLAASGQRLPFPDASFDYVVARHNLEHYVDPFLALREWRRVLASRGRVVAVVPDEEGWVGRTLDLDPTHYHAFTVSFGRSLFQAAGYRVLRAEVCVPSWSLIFVAEREDSDRLSSTGLQP